MNVQEAIETIQTYVDNQRKLADHLAEGSGPIGSGLLHPSDLVSAADIARKIGQMPSTVSNWPVRYTDFPQPVARVTNGRIFVYNWPDVYAWANRHGKINSLRD